MPLQSIEAFRFSDSIIGEHQAYFETAWALGEGDRVWVMAKMPEAMEVVPGDECLKYLLLSNSHSGAGSVTVKFTTMRVVCQNTLMLAMKDGQRAFRIRHSGQMQFKLDELARFLAITQEVFREANEQFRRMARFEMKGDRLANYLAAVFPRSAAQEKTGRRPEVWGHVRSVIEGQEDLQLPGVKGTLLGAYNAVTRFEDYKKPRQEERPDQRLARTWFGGGSETKVRALAEAKVLANL